MVVSNANIAATILFAFACVGVPPLSVNAQERSGEESPTAHVFDLMAPTNALYECDYRSDSCAYPFDGECDAGTAHCPSNSDCFDCDPCQKHRFDGCDACTAAGCVWCASDAICLSAGHVDDLSNFTTSFSKKLSCLTTQDFVSTCADQLSAGHAQSWVFDLINVREAWNMGYTGRGIGVRINDSGVDPTHKDLQESFDTQSSCSLYQPASLDPKQSHGTAVASLVAGSAARGSCGVGIAHGATFSACRTINLEPGGQVAPEVKDFSVFFDNMERMDISQNSFGLPTCFGSTRRRALQARCPFDNDAVCRVCSSMDWDTPRPNPRCERAIASYCQSRVKFAESPDACRDFLDLFTECQYNNLDIPKQSMFRRGALQGRNGKGIVYIFASGNAHNFGADINMSGIATCRYTISVGAVNKDGQHANYSTGGAALHVVAPGGDSDHYTNNVVAASGGGCFDIGPGTSFAAPIVSGVVALMLEANENLSYRDVQGVLATTSRKVENDDWTTNGAGLQHSYLYGFGIVDAGAAVKAALEWTLYPDETQFVAESGAINIPIPEYPGESVTSQVDVTASDLIVESAIVYLDLMHSSRGDLEIVLVSPSGTESILHPGRRPENTQEERWKLLSVRHWGESGEGSWSLRLIDHLQGDVGSCVDKVWSVESSDHVEVNCATLESSLACEYGGMGSEFRLQFAGSTLDSPTLRSADGLTPEKACCACGGGTATGDFDNVLLSWRLSLFGHRLHPEGFATHESQTPAAALENTLVPPRASPLVSSADLNASPVASITPDPTPRLSSPSNEIWDPLRLMPTAVASSSSPTIGDESTPSTAGFPSSSAHKQSLRTGYGLRGLMLMMCTSYVWSERSLFSF